MKILIDIGHPAHVHYFKNFIRIMIERKHEIFVVSRNKEITFQLLDAYHIPYKSRGKGSKGFLGKLLYLFKGDFILIKEAIKFKPDLFLSFGSSYAAHASFVLRKPHIAYDDTEHAKLEHILYAPFTESILTPIDFNKDFGEKQVRFDSTMDIAYLHPNYYTPNNHILRELKLNSDELLFLVRFVSWSASHDKGYGGFSYEGKKDLISLLEKKGRVLISSESDLPLEFKKCKVKIAPDKIHDLMYYCDLFIGESGSMATEAAILGTPSVVVNSSVELFGVFNRIKKYKSLFVFSDDVKAIQKVQDLLVNNSKLQAQNIAKSIIEDSLDTTAFMVWFIENYPHSRNVMRKDPSYQLKFK